MTTTPAPQAVVRRLEAMPLRVRLVAIVLVVLTAALLLTNLATAYLMQRDLMGRVDDELRSVAEPVARQALKDLTQGEQELTPTGYAFALFPVNGPATMVQPTGEEDAHPDLPRIALDDTRLKSGPFTVHSRDSDVDWRFVAGTVGGNEATFAVGVPLQSVKQTVTRLLVTTGALSALVLAVSALLGWYAVRRAFRPLAQIEDTAAAIAGGDLTRRIPVRQAEDEVTSLSRSLNAMLAQIESSFAVREASEDRMRQFVADASHELRTPLATVRGYAELHRQGAISDPADTRAAMERIESESGRMSGLVEDLLTLARLDEEPVAAMGEVDLTVLAADATADARVRAPERRISLVGLSGPLDVTPAWGSESRLRQVVTNLVANAVRHTPEGTPIEVAVGVDGPDGVLEVRDHGAGIPSGTAHRVFERFYRADPSRTRGAGGKGGGNGLGLAIVAAIVSAHDGRVGVQETPGGGATFVVRVPTRPRSQAPGSGPGPGAAPTVPSQVRPSTP
ncbi:two-component system OmpR family sensor kinase [Knoellia remsis]|uniref:histidine kinase n=1 Tax=Knoellia remsis TaxID=407159 RepID=A0A2T0TTZ0_9MICO|nr:HAMP domain-containing sensor histidine kinase [Knoellia remsis]PRY49110.1 two-component system OmpR family sensor kinase [Knoellia remsis]